VNHIVENKYLKMDKRFLIARIKDAEDLLILKEVLIKEQKDMIELLKKEVMKKDCRRF